MRWWLFKEIGEMRSEIGEGEAQNFAGNNRCLQEICPLPKAPSSNQYLRSLISSLLSPISSLLSPISKADLAQLVEQQFRKL